MTQYFTWSVAGWLQVSFSIATEVYVPCNYHRLMYVRAPIQNPQLVHVFTAAMIAALGSSVITGCCHGGPSAGSNP